MPRTVRLKKIQTPRSLTNVSGGKVQATYAVIVDDEVAGHVDKYVERTMTHAGRGHGRGQRHRTDIGWGWRRPGVRQDDTGYDRRADAVDEVLKSLDASEGQ